MESTSRVARPERAGRQATEEPTHRTGLHILQVCLSMIGKAYSRDGAANYSGEKGSAKLDAPAHGPHVRPANGVEGIVSTLDNRRHLWLPRSRGATARKLAVPFHSA